MGYYYYKQHLDLRDGEIVPAQRKYPESEMNHTDESYTNGTVDFLKNRDKSRPFFMYLAYFQPHDPLEVPQKYRDMYPKEGIDLPGNFATDYEPGMRTADDVRRMIQTRRNGSNMKYIKQHPMDEKEMRQNMAIYYAMITHMDYQMGRVLECLEETGEFENTIIVFSGDNGIGMGQHGVVHKQTCYDHSVHVPLMISGPGIPSDQRRSTLCYNPSIYPTLCDLLGLPVPKTVDFKSLVPAFGDENHKMENAVYAMASHDSHDVARGVFDGEFRLIEGNVRPRSFPWAKGLQRRETCLFDMTKDPLQMKNLATSPEYAGKLKEMRTLLLNEKVRHNDNMPFWENFNLLD